jgi:hypothetical protein
MTTIKSVFGGGVAALAVIAFAVLAPSASAAVIGHLDVSNCAAAGVTVTATAIDWLPGTGGLGCIQTGINTSVSFSGGTLGSGQTGSIKDLTAPTTFPVLNFMTFAAAPGLSFDLSSLGPGPSNTVCSSTLNPNGAPCSVFAGSPFTLTPTATGTSVALSATGIARDGTTPNSTWIGAYTTQISGVTPAQIQATILGGGSETSTYSGDFTITAGSTVPEPATIGTMLGGLLLVAGGLFRRGRKSS